MATVVSIPNSNLEKAAVLEFNLNNPNHFAMFCSVFGFHESSIEDIPLVKGIRHFCTTVEGVLVDVFVGENYCNTLVTASEHYRIPLSA